MKFHHIGIATEDIKNLISKLKKYFDIKEISDIIYDPKQDANLCMLTTNDNLKIELISGEVVKNLVRKRQFLYHTCYTVKDLNEMIESLYHTCYTVKNLENMISQLVLDGAILVREPREAVLFNNRKVAFLSSDIGLIELLEEAE